MKPSDLHEGLKLWQKATRTPKKLEEYHDALIDCRALDRWAYQHLGDLIIENLKLKEALLKERAVHVMPYAIYEDLEEEEWEKAKKEARRLLRAEGWDL